MDHSSQRAAQGYIRSPFLDDLHSFDTNQAGSSSSANNSATSPFLDSSSPSYPDFNTPAPDTSGQGTRQNTTTNTSLPPTPYTPSYAAQAGSYNNSPHNSDISFIPGNEFPNPEYDPQTAPFDPEQFDFSGISVLPPDDGYDPSAYDPPTDHNTLFFSADFVNAMVDSDQSIQQQVMTQTNVSPSLSTSSLGSNTAAQNHPHVSVTPAHDSFDGQNALRMGIGNYAPYDQSSPASSNGDGGAGNAGTTTRSRASSVSSVTNHGQLLRGSPQPDNTQTFGMENVTFENAPSPGPTSSWTGGRPPQSPALKGPQSPPQLFIPGGPPEIMHTANSPSPTHSTHSNLSDMKGTAGSVNLPPGGLSARTGPGGLMAPNGPGIQIVPATPVSAGAGAAAVQASAFQQGMDTLNQGQSASQGILTQTQTNSSIWSQQQLPRSPQPSYQTMQQQPESHIRSHSASASPQPRPRLPQAPPSPYTFPSNALTPPPSASATALAEGGEFDAPRQRQGNYSASPQTSPNIGALHLDQLSGGEYLVPIGQNQRSRSKSDTSLRPPIWQIGLNIGQQGAGQSMGNVGTIALPRGPQLPTLNAPQMGGPPGSSPMIQQPQLGQHFSFGPPASGQDPGSAQSGGFLSPNSGLGFNIANDIAGVDMRRARSESAGHKRNALSADMTPRFLEPGDALQGGFSSATSSPYLSANDDLGSVSGNIGAHRRTFSGGNHGHHRSLSRERVALGSSPYPSPHASPRVNTGDLPDVSDQGTNYRQGRGGMRGGTPADSMGIAVHVMGVDANGNPTVQSQAPIVVPRQNVTTHATADASQRRRRTEANFVCPVPGCGSTFTRHFNLKGHLRSHNEERPFKCKWPGCDKGFARQHDCKRHEQLHLNIRPYTCNGCKRTFARMDALNRHLRSDAGTECQASQPILTNEQPNNPDLATITGGTSDSFMNLKDDPETGWQPATSTGVMV